MLEPSLWNYSDTYTDVKWTITVPNTAAPVTDANNIKKKIVFKNCAPFTITPFTST